MAATYPPELAAGGGGGLAAPAALCGSVALCLLLDCTESRGAASPAGSWSILVISRLGRVLPPSAKQLTALVPYGDCKVPAHRGSGCEERGFDHPSTTAVPGSFCFVAAWRL